MFNRRVIFYLDIFIHNYREKPCGMGKKKGKKVAQIAPELMPGAVQPLPNGHYIKDNILYEEKTGKSCPITRSGNDGSFIHGDCEYDKHGKMTGIIGSHGCKGCPGP